MREYDLLIDGKIVTAHGGATLATRNASTGEFVSIVPKTAVRDVRRAIDAARRAADSGIWSEASLRERIGALRGVSDLLWERQTEIADVDTAEAGIPVRASSALVAQAVDRFRERLVIASNEPEGDAREPLGSVGVITGSDAPFSRALNRIGSALLHGNTVVLSPSPLAPSSALEIARAFGESDVPPGVLGVVSGGDHRVNEEIASNALLDHVSVSGAVDGIHRLAERAGAGLRTLEYERPGGSAQIILEDADLDLAIPGALWGAMFLSGQSPRAGTRLFVHASIAEVVTHHLAHGARSLRAGDPSSFDTDVGPMITAAAAGRASASIRRATEEGAKALCGGFLRDSLVAPVILASVTSSMRIAHEDVHAPVLSVISFTTESEVAAEASKSSAATIWTRDASRAMRVARSLRCREIKVNDFEHLNEGDTTDNQAKRIVTGEQAASRARARLPMLGLDRIYGFEAAP